MSIAIISWWLVIMTCYEVGHGPLSRDRGLEEGCGGLPHWPVSFEWGHGIRHRWCRWGTSTPPPTQPFTPGDHSVTAQAPVMFQSHGSPPQPPPPSPQNKTLIGGIMGYRSEGLTALSHLKEKNWNWKKTAEKRSITPLTAQVQFQIFSLVRVGHLPIPFHYWPCDNNLSKQHWRNSSVLARPSV